jgi:hypothetical protein
MTENVFSSLTVDELLGLLERAGRGPNLDLIRAILNQGEATASGLLSMLAAEPGENWDDDDPRWYRNVHAGLLLCALRQQAAIPLFDKIFRDPDQDTRQEWFDMPVAWYYGPAALPMFTAIAQDSSVDEMCRATAVDMLTFIALHHPDVQDTIAQTLRDLLPPLDENGALAVTDAERQDPPELWTWAVSGLMDLRDLPSQSRVLGMFDRDLIYEGIIGGRNDYLAEFKPRARPPSYAGHEEDIFKTFARLYEEARAEEKRRAREVQKLRTRPAARPAKGTPKVGRNEPCPCGSGKKYKKCCGKRG